MQASGDISLPIEGMTCASCVRRVEKALAKVPGVEQADVNLATEHAHVVFDPAVAGLDQLRAAVERAGYQIGAIETPRAIPLPLLTRRPQSRSTSTSSSASGRSTICGANGCQPGGWPRDDGADVPAAESRHDVLAPVLLIVADGRPVLGRARFYRAAWAAAQHGSTNMHTLVAVGTSVAYGYSAFVTLWPRLAQQLGLSRAPVLRDGGHHHRPDPARPLAGGARQEADRRRDQGADGPAGQEPRASFATASSRMFRSRQSRSATWCACVLAKRCRSMASSSRAARRSTRAC